jgi:adenylylsulfate kinase
MSDPTQVVWHEHHITRDQREKLNGHRGCVVWMTGLSGCGKSTIANLVDSQLYQRRVHSLVLDGDNIRHGLNASAQRLAAEYGPEFGDRFGLGFSEMDRQENIRRIAAVAQLCCSAGLVVLTAFVSPYRRDRQAARQYVTQFGRPEDFLEVFVSAPLDVCEARDPKGLYRQARDGKIPNFTGIHDPYEPPENPELTLDSSRHAADQLAARVVDFLQQRGILHTGPSPP